MTEIHQNSNNPVSPTRFTTVGLMIWMLGVMLLGWALLDGPGVSSIIKRVAPLKRTQKVLRGWLGESAEPASSSEGESRI